MVWFYCDGCGDSVKKPKVAGHIRSCRAAHSFSCIDCSRTFDAASVHSHTSCVTEHEKYALGATKAGGFAENGFAGEQPKREERGAAGLQFLATRPPWKCSICNVTCTSEATLQGHAAGAKHIRRAKAAAAAVVSTGSGGHNAGKAGNEGGEDPIAVSVAPEQVAVSLKGDEKKSKKGERRRSGGVESGAGSDGEVAASEANKERSSKKSKKKKASRKDDAERKGGEQGASDTKQVEKKKKKKKRTEDDGSSVAEADGKGSDKKVKKRKGDDVEVTKSAEKKEKKTKKRKT